MEHFASNATAVGVNGVQLDGRAAVLEDGVTLADPFGGEGSGRKADFVANVFLEVLRSAGGYDPRRGDAVAWSRPNTKRTRSA